MAAGKRRAAISKVWKKFKSVLRIPLLTTKQVVIGQAVFLILLGIPLDWDISFLDSVAYVAFALFLAAFLLYLFVERLGERAIRLGIRFVIGPMDALTLILAFAPLPYLILSNPLFVIYLVVLGPALILRFRASKTISENQERWIRGKDQKEMSKNFFEWIPAFVLLIGYKYGLAELLRDYLPSLEIVIRI